MADQDKTGETGLVAGSSTGAQNIPAPAPLETGVNVSPTKSGDVSLTGPASAAPQPASTPVPPKADSVPVPKTGDIENDIANILKGVKLPERRDTSAQAKKPIENKAAVFDTALGAAAGSEAKPPVTATPAPAAPSVPPTSDTDISPSSVVSVHTLKDDLQHVVQDQKISVVRAASLEQDKRARGEGESDRFDSPASPTHSKRTLGILFAAGLLLVLGAGALFGVYTVMQGSATPASQTLPNSSILFAESSLSFPLDNRTPDDLKRSLAGARTSLQGALGSITAIIPGIAVTNPDGSAGKRPATFAEFMGAIGAHPPDALLRALGSNFFFGIHTVDVNAPLFVVPVISYDRAFAGMLAWESTLNADLAPVFTAVPATAQDASGLPINRAFQDDVKQNYDVRELKDDSGQVRLYYSFPTQGILVIAESPYSFAEILSRLQAQREL